MCNSFSKLSSLDFPELFELVEVVQENLDELWKQDDHDAYPQERMSHFLEITSSAFGRALHKLLKNSDVWKESYATVKDNLQNSIQVCEKWVQVCSALTIQFWRNYQLHPWRGEGFKPEKLIMFRKRLAEVGYVYVSEAVCARDFR